MIVQKFLARGDHDMKTGPRPLIKGAWCEKKDTVRRGLFEVYKNGRHRQRRHSAMLLLLGIHGLEDGQTLLMIAFPRKPIRNYIITMMSLVSFDLSPECLEFLVHEFVQL